MREDKYMRMVENGGRENLRMMNNKEMMVEGNRRKLWTRGRSGRKENEKTRGDKDKRLGGNWVMMNCVERERDVRHGEKSADEKNLRGKWGGGGNQKNGAS